MVGNYLMLVIDDDFKIIILW